MKFAYLRLGFFVGGLAAVATPAMATNGFLGICIGSNNCGMGGAGVALPQDSAGAGINPAGLSRLGNEVFISPAWFHPVRTMDAKGSGAVNVTGKQSSANENFLEGAAGLNYRLSNTVTFGASMFGSGGMATKYANPRTAAGAGGGYDSKVRYRLANVLPTITWSPSTSASYGASLVIGYSDIKTDFATLPVFGKTSGDGKLDRAYGLGLRLGGMWDVGSNLTLGLAASTPTWFEKFNKYGDVFIGALNTPANVTAGLAWRATPDTDIAFDVKWIGYKQVRAIGKTPQLGGFGWDDQFVFMVGAQHRLYPKLTLRAGFNYGKSPLANDVIFANALFPAVVESHLTVGASYRITNTMELGISAFYAFENTQTDSGTGDSFSVLGVGTEVSMWQVGAQLGLKWKF